MTVFLIPIFALVQILVIYRYRAAVKEEAEIYERQLELYSANRQTVIEMTGRQSPAEIEKTLDTLNAAFEKLLDDLFQDTAWDLSSDISVLNTMLAQEGLTEDGLNTGGRK